MFNERGGRGGRGHEFCRKRLIVGKWLKLGIGEKARNGKIRNSIFLAIPLNRRRQTPRFYILLCALSQFPENHISHKLA